MAGTLTGHYFKAVIGSLLMGSVIFPELKTRVDAMDGEEWYDWDEYIKLVQRLETKLSHLTLRKVGHNVVARSKEIFVDQGFDSVSKIFEDYDVLFLANVRGARTQDTMRTISFEPGCAVIAVGAQPVDLCIGYLRGIAEMFGGRVDSIESLVVDDGMAVRVVWTEAEDRHRNHERKSRVSDRP